MVEPTGYTALDLIGFTDKGPYDPTANYVKNDLVHVGNSTWRCKIDDTTGITPTEGANWTIFIESATSLAGMSDVDLNTPKAGDGLVHDGNKWTNIPIMTKEQWKKNGAYNLCNNTATTQTVSGITFTKNSDGSISVSGTAGASIEFDIFRVDGSIANSEFIANGKYRLVGCPSSSNDYSLKLRIDGTSMGKDSGNGLTYTCPSFSTLFKVFIAIENGTVITTPLVFKPMITTDLNATYADYVPFAKTNRELSEKEYAFFTPSTSLTFSSQTIIRSGSIVNIDFEFTTPSTAGTITLGTLTKNIPPLRWVYSTAINAAGTYPRLGAIAPTGSSNAGKINIYSVPASTTMSVHFTYSIDSY